MNKEESIERLARVIAGHYASEHDPGPEPTVTDDDRVLAEKIIDEILRED